ncbi:MAG TPA: hypothetical protein VHI51_13300 [Ktedonobacterales bacterium]|nr:hypothetical protein [Ktedonobacterales bacterium]
MSDEANSQSEAPAGSEGAGQGDDLARRQAALRSLAQSATQQPASASATAATQATQARPASKTTPKAPTRSSGFAALIAGEWRAGRRRGVIVGVSLALLVVIVVGGIFGARAYLARRAVAQPKPVLRLDPLGQSNVGCLQSLVWSPDGSELAALGALQGNCGGASPDAPTDAIAIYSVSSGKLITLLKPDLAIFDSAAVEQFAATNNEAAQPMNVYLQGLTWTHDQQALVMTYSVVIQLPEGQNGATPGIFGVLRLGVHNAALTKLWANPTSNIISNGALPRWDLTTGDLSHVPQSTDGSTLFLWYDGGQTVPTGSDSGKPIGSPEAGQMFSIWQAGVLQQSTFSNTPNSPPQSQPQEVVWGSQFAVLSPDDRYYLPYFPAYGVLVPPSPRPLNAQEQQIEPRDGALLDLAKTLVATPLTRSQTAQILVTWRPDGQLLASTTMYSPDASPNASATPQFTVTLHDTRSGQVVARLTPNFNGFQNGQAGQEMLSWSPDGKHLALADNVYGAITIWGPGALPA